MGFIRRRIYTYIGILLVVTNLDFFLPRIAPGSAADILVTTALNSSEQRQLLLARFGLNKPLYVQYYLFLKNLFATWPPNFGLSFQYYPRTVTSLIAARLGWSMLLMLSSLFLSVVLAYFMARRSSLRVGKATDTAFMYGSISSQTVPVFWIAMVLLWVFGFDLRWFPTFGTATPNLPFGLAYVGSVIYHAILPVVVMTLSIFGQNYIVLRGSIQEVLQSDYVVAARTRGLRDRILASAYILRNSLLPLVAILSFSMAGLVSRDVLVEAVFGYNGVGDLLVDGVVNHDYPVLEGTFFVLTLIIILGGLIGDLLLVRLDPRIK